MCSLHFRECDFIEEHSDCNTRRKYSTNKLAKRYLKKDAIPSIFANAPSYLTSSLATPRVSANAATTSGRRQQEAVRLETLLEMFKSDDCVQSLAPNLIMDKLLAETTVPSGFQILLVDELLVILWLRLTDSVPDISASITVKADLTVVLMCDKDEVEAARYKDLLPGRLDTMSQLLNLMALVKGWCEDKEPHPPICHQTSPSRAFRNISKVTTTPTTARNTADRASFYRAAQVIQEEQIQTSLLATADDSGLHSARVKFSCLSSPPGTECSVSAVDKDFVQGHQTSERQHWTGQRGLLEASSVEIECFSEKCGFADRRDLYCQASGVKRWRRARTNFGGGSRIDPAVLHGEVSRREI